MGHLIIDVTASSCWHVCFSCAQIKRTIPANTHYKVTLSPSFPFCLPLYCCLSFIVLSCFMRAFLMMLSNPVYQNMFITLIIMLLMSQISVSDKNSSACWSTTNYKWMKRCYTAACIYYQHQHAWNYFRHCVIGVDLILKTPPCFRGLTFKANISPFKCKIPSSKQCHINT